MFRRYFRHLLKLPHLAFLSQLSGNPALPAVEVFVTGALEALASLWTVALALRGYVGPVITVTWLSHVFHQPGLTGFQETHGRPEIITGDEKFGR